MPTMTKQPPAHSGTVLKIKALDTFMHGRLEMAAGDTETIESGEARELEKAGLVSIETDDVDEGSADTKMDSEVLNKMDDAPSNKTAKPKAK